MNSMPAVSKALCMRSSVRALLDGTPSDNSRRLMVATPTPELSASFNAFQRNKARAALICALDIIFYMVYDIIYIVL